VYKRQAYWYLEPGAYEVTLSQGCKVPADKFLLIRQRSSLLRNGAILHSSVFDAGFETTSIGTVMFIQTPICIEYEARIAQIYAHDSNIVENLYNGQWQGDKQREVTPTV
jgi:dUTP pyrophosphatase